MLDLEFWIAPAIGLGLLVVLLFLFRPRWSGVQGKTAWDWMELLIIPATVGLGTLVFSAAQYQIEAQKQQEEALQQYFDRVSELVLSDVGLTKPKVAVGRAQTAAILSLVSGERTGRLISFLDDIDLLETFIRSFENHDFSGAELKGFNLSNMEFEGANFRDADLEEGTFRGSDFEDTDLRGADLDGADMRDADFDGAQLKGAEMTHTDFRGADLRRAVDLKESDLKEACLGETTLLPKGFKPLTGKSPGCSGRRDQETDD